MRKLSKQEIVDILYGCTILGTGGGGDLELGLAVMQEDFDQEKALYLVELDEIPDDAYVATPYMCGAPAALDAEPEGKFARLPQLGYPESLLAYRTLESYFGQKFFAAASTELGGANTAYALHVACQLGVPIVDADPAGRSVPELQHSSYFVKDIPITPMALATQFGDTMIVKDVVDDFRSEDIVRAVAVASGNKIGVADHPILGEKLRSVTIPGAISYAMRIGEALRLSREKGEDVADALAKAGEGAILFRGTVTDSWFKVEDGFNIGEIELKGIGGYEGQTYRVWYKNENLVSYRNGEIEVTAPDLICVVDKDGVPVTNPNAEKSMELNVFALPAPEIWTSPRGLEVFGPRSFGFDVDYVPFCKKPGK